VVSTQATQWFETDTKEYVDVTAPDNVLVSGRLAKGGVASVHVAAIPHAGAGYRMEIYGSEGTLVASSDDTPQLKVVRLQGAKAGDNTLKDLDVPARHVVTPVTTPSGEPRNVGRLYMKFAEAIRSGVNHTPNFDTAVELHDLLDAIAASSDQGREMMV
jgi:predicted dehydrogenase